MASKGVRSDCILKTFEQLKQSTEWQSNSDLSKKTALSHVTTKKCCEVLVQLEKVEVAANGNVALYKAK